MAQACTSRIQSTRVPLRSRMRFLPKYLGNPARDLIRRENTVCAFMEKLSSEYDGGLWSFHELSNGGFYMAPEGYKSLLIEVAGNGFSGRMSADAAGIVATLFALGQFAAETAETEQGDRFAEQYHALRDFACEHAERTSIFDAID